MSLIPVGTTSPSFRRRVERDDVTEPVYVTKYAAPGKIIKAMPSAVWDYYDSGTWDEAKWMFTPAPDAKRVDQRVFIGHRGFVSKEFAWTLEEAQKQVAARREAKRKSLKRQLKALDEPVEVEEKE